MVEHWRDPSIEDTLKIEIKDFEDEQQEPLVELTRTQKAYIALLRQVRVSHDGSSMQERKKAKRKATLLAMRMDKFSDEQKAGINPLREHLIMTDGRLTKFIILTDLQMEQGHKMNLFLQAREKAGKRR